MNKIFESINVQEGNSDSSIRRVFISSDYEIVVEGLNGKNLAQVLILVVLKNER